jgi:hypothetical protein
MAASVCRIPEPRQSTLGGPCLRVLRRRGQDVAPGVHGRIAAGGGARQHRAPGPRIGQRPPGEPHGLHDRHRRDLGQGRDAQARGDHVAHRVEAAHLHAQAQRPAGGERSLLLLLQERGAGIQADPLLVERVGEGDRRAARERMARRQHEDQLVAAEFAHVQVAGVRSPHEQADVGAALAQRRHHLAGGLLLHVDVHAGLQLRVLREQRRQELVDGGRAGTQADVARDALAQVGQLADQVVHLLQQRQAAAHEGVAGRRGHQAARPPLEQRVTERGFEFADAAAGRGDDEVARPGGRGQAAGLRAGDGEADRDEIESGQVVPGGGQGRLLKRSMLGDARRRVQAPICSASCSASVMPARTLRMWRCVSMGNWAVLKPSHLLRPLTDRL